MFFEKNEINACMISVLASIVKYLIPSEHHAIESLHEQILGNRLQTLAGATVSAREPLTNTSAKNPPAERVVLN